MWKCGWPRGVGAVGKVPELPQASLMVSEVSQGFLPDRVRSGLEVGVLPWVVASSPWELQAGTSQGWVEPGGWIDTLEPSPPLVILGSGKPSPADGLCRFLHGNYAGLTWSELDRVSVMVRASDGGLRYQEGFALQRG